MKPPTLVLDLDGTLVDTAPDLVRALNAVLIAEGMAPVALGASLAMVGHGARAMIEAAFAAAGQAPDTRDLDRLMADFIAHYAAHIADHSRPFAGAEAALDRFAEAGWLLAICTNKLEGLARQLLGALALADRFAAITGQDSFGFRKPDPRHLTETIRLAGGSAARAVMVGDFGHRHRHGQGGGRAGGCGHFRLQFGAGRGPGARPRDRRLRRTLGHGRGPPAGVALTSIRPLP